MIRAGIADVVMLACDLTTPGRPVIGRLASANRTPAGLAAMSRPSRHPVRPRSNLSRPAVRPVCPPLGASARLYGTPPHLPLALAHPLYSYLPGQHGAPRYEWPVDPGRDILCLLISPPRWLQWP
jgi:hypothetical protein